MLHDMSQLIFQQRQEASNRSTAGAAVFAFLSFLFFIGFIFVFLFLSVFVSSLPTSALSPCRRCNEQNALPKLCSNENRFIFVSPFFFRSFDFYGKPCELFVLRRTDRVLKSDAQWKQFSDGSGRRCWVWKKTETCVIFGWGLERPFFSAIMKFECVERNKRKTPANVSQPPTLPRFTLFFYSSHAFLFLFCFMRYRRESENSVNFLFFDPLHGKTLCVFFVPRFLTSCATSKADQSRKWPSHAY